MRKALTACVLLFCVGTGHASPLLQFSPAETTMAPDGQLAIEVQLGSATNLSGFYMEFSLTAQPGATGTVTFAGADGDQNSRYCFFGFNDQFTVQTLSSNLLACGDQTFPVALETNTVAGTNDLLAILTLSSSADAWGDWVLTLDMQTLELFDANAQMIPGFLDIAAPNAIIHVPEPTTVAFLIIGLGLAGWGRRTPA